MTITINTTTTQDSRIAPAVQSIMGLPALATQADVTTFLTHYLRDSVLDFERRQNLANFNPATFT